MKTIFNSTASKAVFAIAVAAVAGLVVAGCGDDNAAGAPTVGNSAKPRDITWSTTLANQALVATLVLALDPVPDAHGQMPIAADLDPANLNAGCPKQTLNYAAVGGVVTFPASIQYTEGWLTLGGAATCTADATGNYTGSFDSMSGSYFATLTGLGATTLTDFTTNGFTTQAMSLTEGGSQTLIDKATTSDRQFDSSENVVVTAKYNNAVSGLPVSGSLNGSGWNHDQSVGNWYATTLAHTQVLSSKTISNVTWSTTLGVTTFNGSYTVSNGNLPVAAADGTYTVTLANVSQNDKCIATGEPDGGKITISNGVAADTIVIDMTDAALTYPADCGSAMVKVGAAASVMTGIFTGPLFTTP